MIELKNQDSYSAFCGFGNDGSVQESEVIRPGLSSGIEEGRELVRFRVDGAEIGAFSTIAVGTSQGKVLEGRGATMLFRNDMFHFKSKESHTLGKAAIFTATGRSLNNLLA